MRHIKLPVLRVFVLSVAVAGTLAAQTATAPPTLQNFNFERYKNPKAWSLVKKLDRTPLSKTATIQSINSQLQTILMQQLPVIPLWYNGQWAQFTSQHWTNWPNGSSRPYTPIMWGGYLNMTGIDMITHLQPVK